MDPESGMLAKDARDQVIKVVLGRLSGLIQFRGKKVKCEEVIEIQVRNIVSYLEDRENYHPFIAGY
jgi:CRISPR/Cas system-associated endonuclease Cas1